MDLSSTRSLKVPSLDFYFKCIVSFSHGCEIAPFPLYSKILVLGLPSGAEVAHSLFAPSLYEALSVFSCLRECWRELLIPIARIAALNSWNRSYDRNADAKKQKMSADYSEAIRVLQ